MAQAPSALERVRHVFREGCGLPPAWAGQPQWRVLETGFGAGLAFLAAWRAWKDDPQRPRLLHFVSIAASPVSAEELRRGAAPYPGLQALAEALAAQWWDLRPGFHRLVFEGGQVLLTLCVGDARAMLREQAFVADSVFLNGDYPGVDPTMWEAQTLKAVARCSRRGTRIASSVAASDVQRDLAQYGFGMEKTDALPPRLHCLKGVFDPAWEPRGQRVSPQPAPGRCVVIGAGLAGAAVAASLARRGWQVQVLDAAVQPASGASGLPAGLLAAHVSLDNNQLSRLSRCGVRMTLQQAQALLNEGDWAASGTLEKRDDGELWHEKAAWIKPAALVRAWLAQTGIEWRGNVQVTRVERVGDAWQLWDAQGIDLGRTALVVVAAAYASGALLGDALPLSPVRGQVSWNFHEDRIKLPAHPLNGNGHFLPAVPWQGKTAWLTGSTYDRDDTGLEARDADHQANFERLRALAPELARQLAPQFEAGQVQAWTGVRCASADRRPLLGEVQPGLWVSTAMGSRGLTFAALCAELLAARLHGEPLPLQRKLAATLDAARRRPLVA